MQLDKKALKEKYRRLLLQEKTIVGEALVKVNLGVGTPAEQRIVAGFLKGSEFIAKSGVLDELITFLQQDEEEGLIRQAAEKTAAIAAMKPSEVAKATQTYDEDEEATEKTTLKKSKDI